MFITALALLFLVKTIKAILKFYSLAAVVDYRSGIVAMKQSNNP